MTQPSNANTRTGGGGGGGSSSLSCAAAPEGSQHRARPRRVGRLGWASRLLVATLVATTVVSGVGAVPWLERADSDGDGTEELGVEWNSLAGEAGAATASGTAGLSCPAGMVLDGDLCKTPKVHTVPATLTCTQPGYVLVSTPGELGASHSCQKTVPAHCTGAKVLHRGQCQTETTEQRDANWSCTEGTLVSTFVDPGYVYSCRIAVDPPECPESAESYLTTPSAGCYVEVSFHQTQDYTWTCSSGTLVTTSGEHGAARSCKVTLASPACPDGETYRNSRCEEQQTFYRTRGYEWTCSSGTLVTTSGEHGVARSCKVTLSPPQCPDGETWRNNRCEEQQTFYRTRGYEWTCSSGTLVTTSGEHGVARSCKVTLSPPQCPNGETWRNNRCETQQTYYDSRPYDYSCPSGYTLGTSGLTRTCTKTETYRTRVCSYDPIAGQQCWWENRTRTLTAAVRRTCPSGFSSDGAGCTADSPSVRWAATGSSPTRHRYDAATKSCMAGYSPAGSVCQADSPSTRWAATGSSPTRFRYDPATKSCISGYSPAGSVCRSDTASKRWVATGSTPTRLRYVPATKSCPSGWSDNGSLCESDTASVRWDATASTPITSRTADAVRSCDAGFAWNDTSGKCEKTTYADPTAPLTKLTGDPPQVSCGDGYKPAGGGRCSKTTLGDPTQPPVAVGCAVHLGSLHGGAIKIQGAWSSGCPSAHLGSAQVPHWAQSFAFSVPSGATLDLDAVSDGDPYMSVADGDATVVGSDDDSGTDGRDSRIRGLRLTAGSYTIEVTTAAPRTTGTFTLTVDTALDEIPVAITGLADGTGWGLAAATVTASDGFTVEPADATCTATSATADVTPTITAGAVAGERTVSLASAAPFSHNVTVRCDAAGRAPAEATATLTAKVAVSTVAVAAGDSCTGTSAAGYACTVPQGGTLPVTATAHGAHGGLSIAWTATGGASAATPTQTAVAATSGAGFSRTSTAALACTADGTVTVTATAAGLAKTALISVTCDIAVACDDPLGELAAGDTARSGTITDSADCVSETRGSDNPPQTHYARRHTFTLAGDATVTIDLADAQADTPALDTWLILLEGRTAAGTPLAQDHRSGPGTDSRITRKLPAGSYTIEATTFFSSDTGRYDLNVDTRYHKQTAITGLTDATKTGSGQVGFARPFTVTPATAQCTPDPDTATVATGTGPADRTLTASIGTPGSLQVTVTCETAGYVAASRTVTLTAQLACSTHLGTLTAGITAHSGGLWGGNPCRSPQRFTDGGTSITRYAHRHTITVTSPLRVQIDLESAAGNRTPLDTYLILLEGHSGDGTGAVLGRDDDSGTGRNSRLSGVELAPGDYTVEATTDKYLRTGDYDLTIDAAPGAGAACTGDLGILAAGRYTRTGTVAAVEGCASAQRGTPTSRPWARWHTFTLAKPAWVDIDLAAATASSLDPYLLLLSGDDNTGTILAQDNSSGTGTAAQIRGRYLQAGTYIIEATAAASTGTTSTGAYTLTVTVPIHGLPQTVDATVDEQTTINFTYWPTTAAVGVGSRSGGLAGAVGTFDLRYGASAGEATMSMEPLFVEQQQLRITHKPATVRGSFGRSTRLTASSGTSTSAQRVFEFAVASDCASGRVVSRHDSVRCLQPSDAGDPSEPVRAVDGDAYRVTYGTYEGVFLGARQGWANYERVNGTSCSSPSLNRLVAVMLTIPYWENIQKDAGGDVSRIKVRSPMLLSRKDLHSVDSRNINLYARRSTSLEPRRAFWHPGVGLWQLDDTFPVRERFDLVRSLDHSERADVRKSAALVAEHLLELLCNKSGTTLNNEVKKAFGPWLGCHPDPDGPDGPKPEKHVCFEQTYPKIITGDRLNVETRHNRNEQSRTGGLLALNCRWGSGPQQFGCHLYDVSNREGYIVHENPSGLIKRKDGKVDGEKSSTPLAQGFLSFTYAADGFASSRFVVFPHSFLDHSTDTYIRAVPDGKDQRERRYGWRTNTFDISPSGQPADYRDLQVQLCRIVSPGSIIKPDCEWHSTNLGALKGYFDRFDLIYRTSRRPFAS